MALVTRRNFHIPLSTELYEQLRSEAERLGRPATSVARQVIEAWLKYQRKAAVHNAIATYAASRAGTAADLDPELERASLEHWLEEEIS